MEDTIDLRMTIKNHAARSQTVRLGFFVENSEGLIYSSYEDAKLKDGLLELRPGEVRKIRLQQPFPGITRDGNVLWFDVRAAGQPARSLFRTAGVTRRARSARSDWTPSPRCARRARISTSA